jgi:hypothetical protein
MARIHVLTCLLAVAAGVAPLISAAEEPAAPVKEKDVPFLGGFLRESRIVYPLAVGDWKAVGEKRYDEQEAGVSIRYSREGEDGWIDLFLYPAGVLSPEQFEELARQEVAGLKQTWLKTPESAKGMSDLRAIEIAQAAKEEPLKAYAVDFAYEYEGQRRSSAMVVLLDRLYVVKGRYSVLAESLSRDAARERLQRLVTELQPLLQISSTGACWSPLPIEPLADPIPEGAVFTINRDGEPTEYVYPDRVLARDPESPSAKVAMMLGMAHFKRLYSGCDGAEPINPDVPEGKREIRIEYAPPGGGPAPVPIRSPRGGLG